MREYAGRIVRNTDQLVDDLDAAMEDSRPWGRRVSSWGFATQGASHVHEDSRPEERPSAKRSGSLAVRVGAAVVAAIAVSGVGTAVFTRVNAEPPSPSVSATARPSTTLASVSATPSTPALVAFQDAQLECRQQLTSAQETFVAPAVAALEELAALRNEAQSFLDTSRYAVIDVSTTESVSSLLASSEGTLAQAISYTTEDCVAIPSAGLSGFDVVTISIPVSSSPSLDEIRNTTAQLQAALDAAQLSHESWIAAAADSDDDEPAEQVPDNSGDQQPQATDQDQQNGAGPAENSPSPSPEVNQPTDTTTPSTPTDDQTTSPTHTQESTPTQEPTPTESAINGNQDGGSQ